MPVDSQTLWPEIASGRLPGAPRWPQGDPRPKTAPKRHRLFYGASSRELGRTISPKTAPRPPPGPQQDLQRPPRGAQEGSPETPKKPPRSLQETQKGNATSTHLDGRATLPKRPKYYSTEPVREVLVEPPCVHFNADLAWRRGEVRCFTLARNKHSFADPVGVCEWDF